MYICTYLRNNNILLPFIYVRTEKENNILNKTHDAHGHWYTRCKMINTNLFKFRTLHLITLISLKRINGNYNKST